jgi:UPF0176 protein
MSKIINIESQKTEKNISESADTAKGPKQDLIQEGVQKGFQNNFQNANQDWTVLIYYKYTDVENPEAEMVFQRELCQKLSLKGRIIIAKEGINATVEGLNADIDTYCKEVEQKFGYIFFKRSGGNGNSFPKLQIRVREEIVSGHFGVNPNEVTGKYITAEELHSWLNPKPGETKKEFYIVDMRNDYEHKSGHFEGSILPPLKNFRDLPKILPTLEHLKDKTIVTCCTGGVRCETASGFLIKNGFKDVYQIEGGIVTYMEKYPNQNFLGKLYVFDGRMLMGFNTDSPEHKIIGKCEICGVVSENYINIKAPNGQRNHIICCEKCIAEEKVILD